jgi:Cu/Ag efflux protein CusF
MIMTGAGNLVSSRTKGGSRTEEIMRKMIVPIAAGLLVIAAAAFAATASGTVKSVDPKAGTVTLDDGVTYMLPATVKANTIKVGSKVTVTFDKTGGKMVASKVEVVK